LTKKKEYLEKKLEVEFRSKAKEAKHEGEDYELKANKALRKKREEKRLYRKYELLHTRAVYSFKAREHKNKMKDYLRRRASALKKKHHQIRRYKHFFKNNKR